MNAELHIQTALKNGRTFLSKVYYTQPFKVANITEDKSAAVLQLMLMSSSPGILDGDEYNINIELAERTSLHLETQAFQRLFSMKKSALQQSRVYLENGASFCFLPFPTVPHKDSDFSARTKIFLSRNCRLVWGEVLTCGRKLSGEIFELSRYHSVTQVYLAGKLVIKENLLIQPASIDVNKIGQMEGHTHQASLIFLDETVVVSDVIKEISGWLAMQREIIFGITTAPVNGLIMRLLGNKGEQLHDCLKMVNKLFLQQNIIADAAGKMTVNAK